VAFWRSLLRERKRMVDPSPSFPRHVPVTEGNERSRRRKQQEGALSQFRLADWIIPPVIVPLFLLLLILAVALLHR
jgi:hypothetical protein